MDNFKDSYFMIALIFAGLGVVWGLALIPFVLFLSIHVYVKHLKESLLERSVIQVINNRLEALERRISFKN